MAGILGSLDKQPPPGGMGQGLDPSGLQPTGRDTPPPRDKGRATAQAGEEQPNVTPEEQAEYDRFMDNALKLIYNEKALPQVIRSLAGGGDPVEGLANTTVMVIGRLEDSAGGHGSINGDVLFHGGVEILEDLADLAGEAGIKDFSEQEIEAALYRALDQYRMMRQGDGTLNEGPMREEFEQLVAADRAGALDQALPELQQHFGQGRLQGGQPPAGGREARR